MKIVCASSILVVYLYLSVTSANLDVLYKRLTSINGRVVSTSRIRHLIHIALCGLGCQDGKKCYQYVYKDGLCYYIIPMEDDLIESDLTPEEKKLLKQGVSQQADPSLIIDAPPLMMDGRVAQTTTLKPRKQSAQQSCEGKDYNMVGGKYCMKLFTDFKRWTKADEQCRQDGGYLVTIKSEEKFKLLQQFIKEKGAKEVGRKQRVFVGADDRKKENNWRWSDGSEITPGSFVWLPGEPNNYQDEDCGAISMEWDYLMVDESCNRYRPFVCELKL